MPKIKVDIKHDTFFNEMEAFFSIESMIGITDEYKFLNSLKKVESLFIRNVLLLLYAYDLYEKGQYNELVKWFQKIPYNDLKLVAAEYVSRKNDYLCQELCKENLKCLEMDII